jgi:hypothetical protein
MWSKTSVFCVALVAVVLVASNASGQTKADDLEQIKKELAALRAEVKVLKEEVARLTAAKQLADNVKAWTAAGAEVTERKPLSFVPPVAESVVHKGEPAIRVFSFTRLDVRKRLAPNETRLKLPGVTDQQEGLYIGVRGGKDGGDVYRVSTWKEGVLAELPDPGTPFGLDLVGTNSGPTMTDTGLKGLARMKSLQWLNLANRPIGDAALKEVAGLKNLKWLDLQSTKVTDTGLKELAGLKNLQALDLRGTQVTEAGVAALQKALPACKIQR